MKTTLRCIKCDGRKIWRVQEVHHDNQYQRGALMRVAFQKAIGPPSTGFLSTGDPTTISVGHFDLYVCSACGYSEWYAQDFDELCSIPGAGVELLDGDPKQPPYR